MMSIKITNGPRHRRANALHTAVQLLEGAYLAGPYHDPENDEYSWSLYTWLEGRDMEKAQDAALEAVGSGADFIDEWEPIHKSDARRWLLDIRDEQEFPGEPDRPDWARITIAKSKRENKKRKHNSKASHRLTVIPGWATMHEVTRSRALQEHEAKLVSGCRVRALGGRFDGETGLIVREGPGREYEVRFDDGLRAFVESRYLEVLSRKANARSAPDKYGDRTGYHMSLSYGELPTKAKFLSIFKEEMDGGDYGITLRGSDAAIAKEAGVATSGSFNGEELWEYINELVDSEDDGNNGMSIVSGVLETLGIEWV